MRPSPTIRFAAALVLLVSGCPKSPTTGPPAQANPEHATSEDSRVAKFARILRAADRRVVDDDLRSLLADDDVAVRAKTALALGQIGDPSSLPVLESAATDASTEPRTSAAFAMGLIADASSLAVLERLADDPSPEVRAAAAEALGRLHIAGAAPTVRALLDDPDVPVRAAATLGTWKFENPGPFLDVLIANLAAADPSLRIASAYAVGRLASAPFVPASSGAPVGRLSDADTTRARAALAEHVTDTEAEVRMHIARGLASPRSVAEIAVVGALSKDRDPRVRVNSVRAFGHPGISIKPYLERALADHDFGVATAALEAVGSVGGRAALDQLGAVIVKYDNPRLRHTGLIALAKADPSSAPDIVSGLLVNPDPSMRGAAAALLAGRKEPGAIRAALALLGDAQPRVQALAVPIVADQDGPVSKLLAGFFSSPDPVVRAAVGDAVAGRFATPRVPAESRDELFARLEEIWAASASDTIPDAKLAVVDAAAKAGRDDKTRAALARALADPDVVVRRRAAARFRDVYEEDRSRDVGPSADRPLADYERIVRWTQTAHTAVITVQRPGTLPGRFTVALDGAAAPMAAWNFAELASKNFFDGATLHRVVPNFVVQDGDPRGDGYGGPGYSIRDEFNPLRFTAGVLGMASDGKDTAGSQWFITLSPQPHLDGRYTSFGRVTRGFREIVTQMRPEDTIVSIRIDEPSGAAAN